MFEQGSHIWGLYLVAFISIAGIIWKFGNWAGKVNSSLENLEAGLENLKVGLENLKARLDKANDNINKIFERLPPPKTTETTSPLSLTEFGKRISTEISASDWATKHVNYLIDKVKDKEEFEIFQKCTEYVDDEFNRDEELKRKVNAAAYDNGTEPEEILMIYRIELRNCILAKLRDKTADHV